jgi:hypothetical protein
MAIIDPWNIPIDIKREEYAISGKMLQHNLSIHEFELMKIDPKTFEFEIKKRLMFGMIDEIMKYRCVEFTRQQNNTTFDTLFRARMFVVPDDQVRILRVSQINNNG